MRVVVGVADMKISSRREDIIITHALGSCLGIAAYDSGSTVGGVLHVMMPSAQINLEKAKSNPYMFVDTGVPAFFRELYSAGGVKRRLVVKVAGGADVQSNPGNGFEIGRRNYAILRKMFWKNGVLIDGEDVGGGCARTLWLEVGTGRVWLSANGIEKEL